jgi:hypothetical protein
MANTTAVARVSMVAHHRSAEPDCWGRDTTLLARNVTTNDAATGMNAATRRTATLSHGRVRHSIASLRAGASVFGTAVIVAIVQSNGVHPATHQCRPTGSPGKTSFTQDSAKTPLGKTIGDQQREDLVHRVLPVRSSSSILFYSAGLVATCQADGPDRPTRNDSVGGWA